MKNVKQQKFCFAMTLLQYAFAVILYFFYTKNNGKLPVEFLLQCTNILLVGGTISLLAWRHSVLSWNAFLEKRNSDENPVQENIFNNEVDMSGRQERAFVQFNKILLPIVLIAISIGEFFISARILFVGIKPVETPEGSFLVIAAVLTALAITLFLAGKYMAGLAFDEKHHFLRPVSGYLLLNAFSLFLGVITALAYYFGKDLLTGFVWSSIILSFLLASERILLWVVDLYRPKGKNDAYIPVYESRILALFSQPQGVFGNLASMLEYQFGIKVSESFFSTFTKKALIPFICIQLMTLFLLSSLTYIRPYEEGLKFSWGQSKFEVLEPGLHITAPWPFCKVERFDVDRIKEINLTQSDMFDKEYKRGDADIWQNEAYKNLMSMVAVKSNEASDHNLVVANVTLRYTISDVMKFRSSYIDGEQALKMYGQQLLSRTLLESDFNYILKEGLEEYTKSLKSELQRTAGVELGVDIVDVSVINFQPPPEVAESFQATLGAIQDSVKEMTLAEKYATSILSKAEVLADKNVKDARSNTILKSLLLDAEAASFDEQLRAYKKTPLLYENQAVMIALESWIKDVRKIVNLTNASKEIITLELKKNEPGLLNME